MTSKIPKSQILNPKSLEEKMKKKEKKKKGKKKWKERKQKEKKPDQYPHISTFAPAVHLQTFPPFLLKPCAVRNKFRAKDRFWKPTENSSCASKILIFHGSLWQYIRVISLHNDRRLYSGEVGTW